MSLEKGLPSSASDHGIPPMNMIETMSPCACAKSCAVRTPSSERSAGHGVNPMKKGRVRGPEVTTRGAGPAAGTVGLADVAELELALVRRASGLMGAQPTKKKIKASIVDALRWIRIK